MEDFSRLALEGTKILSTASSIEEESQAPPSFEETMKISGLGTIPKAAVHLVEEEEYINSPNATAWLRSQGLLFKQEVERPLPVASAEPPPFDREQMEGILEDNSILPPPPPFHSMDHVDVPPPPEETPPSYWRQRFQKPAVAPVAATTAPKALESPEARREVEPQATPSPSSNHSIDGLASLSTRVEARDDVDIEVERWIEEVKKKTNVAPVASADANGELGDDPALMNAFQSSNSNLPDRSHEPQSLADLIASPGSIRGCFEGYCTSDTEQNGSDEENSNQAHALEARDILSTWARAEKEAATLRSKALKSSKVNNVAQMEGARVRSRNGYNNSLFERPPPKRAGADEDPYSILRAEERGKMYQLRRPIAETGEPPKQKKQYVLRNEKGHVIPQGSNPALVIEERQRVLREKRKLRKLRQAEKSKVESEKEHSMGKLEKMRYRARQQAKKRRAWRERQKDQRDKQSRRHGNAPVGNGSRRRDNPLSKSIGTLNHLVEKQEDQVRKMRLDFEEKLKRESEEKEKAKVREHLRRRLERAKREKMAIAKEEIRRRHRWTLLYQVWGAWRTYAQEKWAKREALAKRRAALARAWKGWSFFVVDQADLRRKSRESERRAREYSEWLYKTHVWGRWAKFVAARICYRVRQRKIAYFAWHTRARRYFARWNVRAREIIGRRERRQRADALALWTRLNKNFQRWSTYVIETKKARERKRRRAKLDRLVQRNQIEDSIENDGPPAPSPYESKYDEGAIPERPTTIAKPLKSKASARPQVAALSTSSLGSAVAEAEIIQDKAYESKYCEFLVSMEQRAEQRRKKRDARRLRQAKAEQEKRDLECAKMKLATLAKDASKGGRLYLRRYEAKCRKGLEEEKQKKVEHRQMQWGKAITQNMKLCVKYYGFRPWALFHILKRMERVRAVSHWERVMQKKCLTRWTNFAHDCKRSRAIERMRKEARAKSYYRSKLKSKVFRGLVGYHKALVVRERAIRRQREYRIQKSALAFLMRSARDNARHRMTRVRKAEHYYVHRFARNILRKWKEAVPLLKQEQKASQRRRMIRSRVDGWLKDDTRL